MPRKRYSEEQIIRILREAESGKSIEDVCRANGIANVTFYRWRRKYAGMEVKDARRLREIEAENAKLKRKLAEQMLEIDDLKHLLGKDW